MKSKTILHSCAKKLADWQRLISVILKTLTPFNALRRIATFSEFLYPQIITWDKKTRGPIPNSGFKLVPWFLISGVAILAALPTFWIGIREIISNKKDPAISVAHSLIIIFHFCDQSVVIGIIFTLLCKTRESCYIFGSLIRLSNLDELKGKIIYLTREHTEVSNELRVDTYTKMTTTHDLFNKLKEFPCKIRFSSRCDDICDERMTIGLPKRERSAAERSDRTHVVFRDFKFQITYTPLIFFKLS
ncbi:hypothetical protein Fcan01_17443 [Folsomia candida]|uniref:Uncharacterized protein n=1 Tax=Folsomia candida TaxID=158441 RepID=A0A226DU79_FOLCA|nr:hypothetical protein Fcan01_17443 [Folsomia candida]